MSRDPKDKASDDFWNLDEFVPKHSRKTADAYKQFSAKATSAVEIEVGEDQNSTTKPYTDSRLTSRTSSSRPSNKNNEDGMITRFIPPHSDSAFVKKYTLFEYEPDNPLIKQVRIYSEKEGEGVFIESNLFMRERRALLRRSGTECAHVSYYSYAPRYSQMNRAQLNWYLWWRDNTRRGIFLKTDESYVILYAYELAATGVNEDRQAALDMLCSLLDAYSDKDLNTVFRLMIRDLICDFCLLHAFPSPIDRLKGMDRQLLANAFLPEFLLDLSDARREYTVSTGLSSLAMYDYRRSKFYTEETADTFKCVMNGALAAIFNDEKALHAITSFTEGMYGQVTVERRPFARMINVVNRNVKFEITYYQLTNIQSAITDAVRYSENKLRDHMGIKNKLHVLAINPSVKDALDRFFAEHYPPLPVIDRRRRSSCDNEPEVHEYDKLYDVPKAEISPEHALEIERDSWSTTKILTEAFSDGEYRNEEMLEEPPVPVFNAPELILEPPEKPLVPQGATAEASSTETQTAKGELLRQIRDTVGVLADFIPLCMNGTVMEQRAFARDKGLSLDEIADRINECAVEVFGDIVLEDNGGSYTIIEDYRDQF